MSATGSTPADYGFPRHWTFEQAVLHLLSEILENQRIQMAAIDNLNSNIATLKTDVEALIAATKDNSEAAIQSAADAVAAVDAEVKAAMPA